MRPWIATTVACLCFGAGPVLSQSVTDARKGCEATLQELARSATKADMTSALSVWTDDATDIEADGTVYKGKAGLKHLFERQKTVAITSAKPVIDDFGSNGPLAYAGGILTLEGTDRTTGKAIRHAVHFLFIFKQQADKHWLISHEVDSPIREPKAAGN